VSLSDRTDMYPSRAKIMYVEDDADTRQLVSYVLARAGYEVVVAENYKQAARLAQATSFDLYLIHNWMPGDLHRVEFLVA